MCKLQRSFHINRVSQVIPVNSLKKSIVRSILSYFLGSIVIRTEEQSIMDRIKNASLASLQPSGRC
jgi:hypothetical protein